MVRYKADHDLPEPADQATFRRAPRPQGLVSRLARLAVTFGALTAVAFIAIPLALPRAIAVIALSAISGFWAVRLSAIVVRQGIRGQWRKPWLVAAAVVLAIEAVLVEGLNTYADSRAASAAALVQDSYAEVAAAVSLGDAIQKGRAPSGVTYARVQTQASAASSWLTALDVPGQLTGYTSSVRAWANDVAAAAMKAQSGSPWQGVPYTPAPFDVSMTGGQARAAFATSLQQTAALIEFGNRAVAAHDLAAMRYIGARLDAQSYWLEGIYTSADPNVVAAQLHFIEPVTAATPSGAVADGDPGVRLLAAITPTGFWRAPRRVPVCLRDICVSRVRGPILQLWRSAINYSVACAAAGGIFNGACVSDAGQQWQTNGEQVLPMIDASGAQPIGGAGAGVATPVTPQLPPRLQAFYDECKARGGTTSGSMSVMDRLPTTEGGTTCHTNGSHCWIFLTYSGTQYRGGEPGCPEEGLVPRPYGPVGGIVTQVGNVLTQLIPALPTWDGTYNLQRSSLQCVSSGNSAYGVSIRSSLEQVVPSSALLVSGNSVEGPNGPAPIDSTGHAAYTFPIENIGTLSANYFFTHGAGGVAQVLGKYEINAGMSTGTESVRVDCSSPFSGTRG